MTAESFTKLFYKEKEDLLKTFTTPGSETLVSTLVAQLELSPSQKFLMKDVIDAVLTDAFYTILLGLDGAASIGGVQQDYSIIDEAGVTLTGGDIEAHAYDLFHGEVEN